MYCQNIITEMMPPVIASFILYNTIYCQNMPPATYML